MITIGIGGVYGRMGQSIVLAAGTTSGLRIAGGIARADSGGRSDLSHDFPVIANLRDLVGQIDVFIDFSTAEAMAAHLEICAGSGVPFVSGVTGLDAEHRERLAEAAASIPVFYASNFSIGVAVVTELVRMAAAWLPETDAEVVELHHRRKRDAPSGTALTLIEAIEEARADDEQRRVPGRAGQSLGLAGEIGVHSLRGGGNAGEHQVLFAGEGEEVWIGQRALSRATFADGALRAARWVIGRPPGLYGMKNLISEEAR